MKKLLAILLSLLLLLTAFACGAEEKPVSEATPAAAETPAVEPTAPQAPENEPAEVQQEEPLPSKAIGEWFAEVQGVIAEIMLNEDGTYAVEIPVKPDANISGTWEERDGFLYLDGNELPSVNVLGDDVMKWIDYDVFLRREAPLPIYAPAELLENVPAELYTGYWEAKYADVNGMMLFSDTLGSQTAALIDGTTVALIGPLTGETVLETAYENGALTWTEKDVGITFALQEDGFLRMTVETDGEPVTLYLMP